ncbi:hypothetical protein AMTR_s00134p00028280 [Amborella trichopoda]|uniref:Uncharacterized protein n=1 Tax=Amborella trichopoda TaxID=13333 RepID=W1P4V0_AMBTC|nr:hypothetical protein AMTR_s00134p00028280 [Amborella trichopoda]
MQVICRSLAALLCTWPSLRVPRHIFMMTCHWKVIARSSLWIACNSIFSLPRNLLFGSREGKGQSLGGEEIYWVEFHSTILDKERSDAESGAQSLVRYVVYFAGENHVRIAL